MSQLVRIFSLEGKDYFDQFEAAEYMCISTSKFHQALEDPRCKIKVVNSIGKRLFKKTELKTEIERQNRLKKRV